MKIPQGIKTKGESRTTYVFKILNNLCEQRQGSRVWKQNIIKGLKEIGFLQSRVNCFIFYWRKAMLIFYVDNSIFDSLSNAAIDQVITEIEAKFYIEYQGAIYNYIGFNIEYLPNVNINIFNLTWLTKLCRTWTSREGPHHTQCQASP